MSMNFPPTFSPNFPMNPMGAPTQGLPPAAAPQFPMAPQPGFPMPFQSQAALTPAVSEMPNSGTPGAMFPQPMTGQPQPAPGLLPGFNPAMPPQGTLGQQPQPMPGLPFPGPQPGMMPPMGNGMSLNLLA